MSSTNLVLLLFLVFVGLIGGYQWLLHNRPQPWTPHSQHVYS